jgi:hypothetical protein
MFSAIEIDAVDAPPLLVIVGVSLAPWMVTVICEVLETPDVSFIVYVNTSDNVFDVVRKA